MRPLIGTDLKRFLRDYKRRHQHARELVLLLQSVEYPFNVGAIIRMADGAGVNKLILTGITPTPPNPTIDKVARSKSKSINWIYSREPIEPINELKGEGYEIVGLELTNESVPYSEFTFPKKICLVLGNEDHGLTKSTLGLCDAAVFVPMYGKGRSHNVGTAASIVTYHILQSDYPDN